MREERKRLEEIRERLDSLGRKEVALMSIAATELIDADIPWLLEQLERLQKLCGGIRDALAAVKKT